MKEIRYILNKDIDRTLWDKCISHSINGNVYAYSWFLDSVCKNWDGLVVGDYYSVMPVPIKRYFGLKVVKQPIFFNKSNIYVNNKKDDNFFRKIIDELKKHAFMVEIRTGNEKLIPENTKYSVFSSYKLDLIGTYKNISSNYSEDFKNKLNLIKNKKIFFNTGLLPKGIGLLAGVSGSLGKNDALKLGLLSSAAMRKKSGEIYGAFNEKNKLIAAVLFISSHYKTNIIYAVLSKEAKKNSAIYGLVDHYIKMHSEKALTLDFQGLSYLENNFFESIGAVRYLYYQIKLKSF